MSDKKPDINTNMDVMLADVMLRLAALENLLIEKKAFTQEELIHCTEELAKKVAKGVLEKMQGSADLKDFIAKLEASNSKQDKKEIIKN